jgi:hypothetical protein
MTFEDDRTAFPADQRIDRLAEWLEMMLGVRLTAFAVGVTTGEIARVAHGDEQPVAEVDRRLRNLYRATWFVASNDGPGSAHDWLMAPNPELAGRTPAELLRAGETPSRAWYSAATVF